MEIIATALDGLSIIVVADCQILACALLLHGF
jgi:hypothetical protein